MVVYIEYTICSRVPIQRPSTDFSLGLTDTFRPKYEVKFEQIPRSASQPDGLTD